MNAKRGCEYKAGTVNTKDGPPDHQAPSHISFHQYKPPSTSSSTNTFPSNAQPLPPPHLLLLLPPHRRFLTQLGRPKRRCAAPGILAQDAPVDVVHGLGVKQLQGVGGGRKGVGISFGGCRRLALGKGGGEVTTCGVGCGGRA